jgi:hypothetical protein
MTLEVCTRASASLPPPRPLPRTVLNGPSSFASRLSGAGYAGEMHQITRVHGRMGGRTITGHSRTELPAVTSRWPSTSKAAAES